MKIITTAETAKGKLVYTLFSENLDNSERYGISVTSTIFGTTETASLSDISSEMDFTEKLLYLMADNLVLPSTFREVAEEYVAAAFTA